MAQPSSSTNVPVHSLICNCEASHLVPLSGQHLCCTFGKPKDTNQSYLAKSVVSFAKDQDLCELKNEIADLISRNSRRVKEATSALSSTKVVKVIKVFITGSSLQLNPLNLCGSILVFFCCDLSSPSWFYQTIAIGSPSEPRDHKL